MPESIARQGLFAVAVVVAMDLIVFVLSRAIGVPFRVGLRVIDNMGGVTWYFVAGVAAIATAAAIVFAAFLRRKLTLSRGARVFGWTIGVATAASCVLLVVLGLRFDTTVALMLLHLVSGAAVSATLLPLFRGE
ncbi:hypothetical protein SAMN05421504_102645 [Amycolatopsis xylanica]|uniref:Uncharacterized protein n=1 Tax=Amycolatopsis xylanica TaxID=589385 RepID=A0A1H2ZRL5_9PSEU|nr:DUF6069 family protein [Amycolatopsis xylanica]SDX20192.1 hypothetical protein SAMN05421504_102645 [Amycolatopsis xylanica]